MKRFSDWMENEHRTVLPKSPFGQAVSYARNQWPTLGRYLDDVRFSIDNNAAERAVRPLAVGRKNWLFVAGDGGLRTAAILMSLCASAKRHALNPARPVEQLKLIFNDRDIRRGSPVFAQFFPEQTEMPSGQFR